jgi:hypothetical protein
LEPHERAGHRIRRIFFAGSKVADIGDARSKVYYNLESQS